MESFSYTAERGLFATVVGSLLALSVVEAAVVVALILLLVPGALFKAVLLAALGVLIVVLFGYILSPLFTGHRLTESRLELRYGLILRADLPRAAIRGARPTSERRSFPGASHEAEKGRVAATFSDRGQVELTLDEPAPLRIGLSRVLADKVLLNVDDRDAFLSAVGSTDGERATADARPEAQARGRPSGSVRLRTAQPGGATTGTAESGIAVEGLRRSYGRLVAVRDLDLSVRYGEIYGFLGSNGAGKTTTIKMLVGLLEPTAGRTRVAGHDVWDEPLAAKANLGFVPDRSILYERLSGREFLSFLAQMRGLPRGEAEGRIGELLGLLDLSDRADDPCGSYSFGMKRKLSLAGALLHRPRVLVLDEPLNGLDPRSARRLKDLLAELAAAGATVFLSTHDLATAEEVCHRVGVVHRGRLLAEGSADELRSLAAAPDLEAAFLALTTEERETG